MTFFIAAILIYQFEMPSWMYGVAAAVWIARTLVKVWMDICHSDETVSKATSQFRRYQR